MRKMTQKKLDELIDALYRKHAAGRHINILDIGKVFKMGEAAAAKHDNRPTPACLAAVNEAIVEAVKLHTTAAA